MLDSVYDVFLERLVQATRSLKVGPAEDPATRLRPGHRRRGVRADSRVHRPGRSEAARSSAGDVKARWPSEGFYIGAAYFRRRDRRVAAGPEEIFGPVLAVIKPETWTRPSTSPTTPTTPSPAAFSAAVRPISAGPAGNAGRQPLLEPRHHRGPGRSPTVRRLQAFGHRIKAGGPDYLLQFVFRSTSPKTRSAAASPRRPRPRQSNADFFGPPPTFLAFLGAEKGDFFGVHPKKSQNGSSASPKKSRNGSRPTPAILAAKISASRPRRFSAFVPTVSTPVVLDCQPAAILKGDDDPVSDRDRSRV